MNIITAINDEKIFNDLKKQKNTNIISEDIQYKEGILEILEKNKNIDYIIFREDLYGQIKIEEIINRIKKINKKIKIIIILIKKDLIKENFLINKKINYIYKKELCSEKIIEIFCNKNKIIAIVGNYGTGKTITTVILSEIIAKNENKKILIIEDNIKNNSLFKFYKIKNKIKTIKIKNNIDLFFINKILINYKKNKTKIINEINRIKNKYNYIFIDMQNINSLKIYEEIIDETILLINPNILEINKIKKILNNNNKMKILLNNYNENSISEKLIKNIINENKKIIGKINYNKNYDLLINNNFNLDFLDIKTKNKFLKILKKI